MSASYAPTPYLWLTIASLIFYALLGSYAWRRRQMPAALPFALFCLFAGLWTLGHGFELKAIAASAPSAWLFWVLFQMAWQLPATTVLFCFVAQYAGNGHWLTRRVVVWLALPSLVFVLLLLTNDLHNLLWRPPPASLGASLQLGPAAWLFNISARRSTAGRRASS